MTENKSISMRMDKLLEVLFLFALVLVGWGPVNIPGGTNNPLVIYGSTWESFLTLFYFYLICRIISRNVRPGPSWKDPFLVFGILALLSVTWNPLKDFTLVTDYYFPALAGYFIFRYLLSRNFVLFSGPFWSCFLLTLALMIIRGLTQHPDILVNASPLNSLFFHHNHIAMNLILGIPAALVLLNRDGTQRYISLLCLLFMLPGLAMTNSRSGWVGAIVAFCYLLWKISSTRLKKLALLVVLALALCIGLYSTPRARFATLAKPLQDTSFKCRLNMWQVSAYLIRTHPLLGISFSNRIFMAYENKAAIILYSRGLITEPELFDPHPHNLFLQIVVTLGVGGLILLLWIFHDLWKALHSLGVKCRDDRPMLIAIKASLWGFMAANMADTAFNNPQSTLFIMLIFAYIFEWEKYLQKQVHEPPAEARVESEKQGPSA
jgi:O-antigen ligase